MADKHNCSSRGRRDVECCRHNYNLETQTPQGRTLLRACGVQQTVFRPGVPEKSGALCLSTSGASARLCVISKPKHGMAPLRRVLAIGHARTAKLTGQHKMENVSPLNAGAIRSPLMAADSYYGIRGRLDDTNRNRMRRIGETGRLSNPEIPSPLHADAAASAFRGLRFSFCFSLYEPLQPRVDRSSSFFWGDLFLFSALCFRFKLIF